MKQPKQPILPVLAPTKQQAIRVASGLSAYLVEGKNLNAPIGKYALRICEIFRIPLLPGEDAIKVAFDKLQEWRHAISFNIVKAAEFEKILPDLIEVYGKNSELGIRGAIASEIATREKRKAASRYRKPKEQYRHRQATNSPLFIPDDPYAG